MTTSIKLSNETFWEWLKDKIILGNVDYFDDMIYIERYATGQAFKKSQRRNPPIFHNLKDVIPPDYFLEMEYCALAYSVIFDKVFPPLSQHIEQLAYIEWLLYVEPEYLNYRDHFVHVLKVAFVCDEIFRKVLSENMVDWQAQDRHFKDWCKKENISFNIKKMEKIIHAAVFLSSIFHDIGYGYQFVRGYEEKLFRLNLLGCDSIDITKNRGDILKRSLLASFIIEHHEWGKSKELKISQRESLVLGFFRDCLPLNHSIASALTILDIAEDLYRSHIINLELYVAFQIAAEACCFHDMTTLKKYLHLENSGECNHFLDCKIYESIPVAILLILADELSMWSRPRIEYVSGENGREKTTRLHNRWKKDQLYPNKIDLEFTEKELTITLDNLEQNKIFKEELLSLPVLGDAINAGCLSVFNYAVNC